MVRDGHRGVRNTKFSTPLLFFHADFAAQVMLVFALTVPKADVRRMMHALREPVSAFAINLSLLKNDDLSQEARTRVDAMRRSVERMNEALSELTEKFGLEVGLEGATEVVMPSEARRPNGLR
jgi:hypothetical protein